MNDEESENEEFLNRPYKALSRFDTKGRSLLSDGWEYPREASTVVSAGGPTPLPIGPGTFLLPFMVHEWIKTIEVKYLFRAGHEATIQALEEGAPVHKLSAPEGDVIIPVGDVRQWVIHLPAGTQVVAYIDKWQKDLEAMARLPKWEVSPEQLERGRRALEEARKSRQQG